MREHLSYAKKRQTMKKTTYVLDIIKFDLCACVRSFIRSCVCVWSMFMIMILNLCNEIAKVPNGCDRHQTHINYSIDIENPQQ